AATGERFAGAPLKHAQPGMAAINHLQKTNIGAGRKPRMLFQLRAEAFHRRRIDIVHHQYPVGITHGNGRQLNRLAIHIDGVDILALIGREGDRRRVELRYPHIDRHQAVPTHLEFNHTLGGLYPDNTFIGQALIPHKACKAAGAVAALLYFRAIGIENAVAKIHIRQPRWFHHQQLVKTDAEITIRQLPDAVRAQPEWLADGVYHHEVVAQPVHLGKPQDRALAASLLRHLVPPAHSGRQLSGASWSSRVSRRRTTCTWSPSTIDRKSVV